MPSVAFGVDEDVVADVPVLDELEDAVLEDVAKVDVVLVVGADGCESVAFYNLMGLQRLLRSAYTARCRLHPAFRSEVISVLRQMKAFAVVVLPLQSIQLVFYNGHGNQSINQQAQAYLGWANGIGRT